MQYRWRYKDSKWVCSRRLMNKEIEKRLKVTFTDRIETGAKRHLRTILTINDIFQKIGPIP